jgi:cytochrome c553
MKTLFTALFGILVFASCVRLAATPQAAANNQKTPKASGSNKAAADPGEVKFKENCGRCHNPPDTLSPREVKAVVQHMRVRAMLSEEDEQLILKYLAP